MPPKRRSNRLAISTTRPRQRLNRRTTPINNETTEQPDQPQNSSSTNWVDMMEADTSESENETQTNFNSSKSKPKIQIFKGFNDKVSVENWLKRYEMIAKYYNFSEKDKVVMLGNYLEDDALNWYIENCNDFKYNSLKSKLIARFGIETVEPIVEFFSLKYDYKSGIKEYFEKKRRFGVSAKLTEEQMIPVMIQGLHPKMIDSFVAVKPKTFTDFYTIAKTAENNYKRNFNTSNKTNENKFKPKTDVNYTNVNKIKKKPPNPCRICEGLGFTNRYHWAQDCKNKSSKVNNSNSNSNTIPKVNLIEKNSNNDINSENDIQNTLN